jgi:hypothetical protein
VTAKTEDMSDEHRRTIIDRANRMLRQSKALRKLSDELLRESRDIRRAAEASKPERKKPVRSVREEN